MKKSNKLTKRLEEARDQAIIKMFKQMITAEEIGIIFDLSTSTVYNILKEQKN